MVEAATVCEVEVRLPLRLCAAEQLGVEEGDGVVELEDDLVKVRGSGEDWRWRWRWGWG